VWFPRGGTGALVAGMARLFTDLGGEVRLSTPVEQIVVEGDRVTGVHTSDGEFLPADLVASNGEVVHTYDRLLGHHPRGREAARRLKQRRFSMSLFVLYFGLRGAPPAELRHHTILFGPRYKELVQAICGGQPLQEDFSLYLHAPSVSDPSLAPEGCSAYYVLSPVPNLSQPIDWEREGPKYADRILETLERRAIPGLRERLVTQRMLTPLDFQGELRSHLGSAFSLEPILTQSAYFRVHNRDDVLRNLYFVGAGSHPGAGVPGVVGSAKATASVIASYFLEKAAA
jgi:phytoene desaturase